MEALEELERRIQNLEDSKSHQSFQIQDPYSIFQVPQQEEHTDFKKSTESMIKFQSDPLNMIEARLSRLENMCRNEKTLPTQSLTAPNSSNHIDENQVSWNFEDFDQDSISPQNLELDQYQPIDDVAPRSGGYGDATAMYIRRSEIPSRIYAKLQYRQESEAEEQW